MLCFCFVNIGSLSRFLDDSGCLISILFLIFNHRHKNELKEPLTMSLTFIHL